MTKDLKAEFRADIEGLRAVAILPILVFHLDPLLLPGGFIGVDVFFVISGYLITGQILKSGLSRFRFLSFYVRRIRRLFPALAVTVAVSLIAAWRLLTPPDFLSLAWSAIASLSGVSNIYFYTSVGYFNDSILLHPLLHIWSLSAEEQFYLVWPIILVVGMSVGGRCFILIIGAMAVGSLVLSAFVVQFDPRFNFYMMPFRIYQFSIGAAALLLERRVPEKLISLFGLAGSVLLGASFFIFDGKTPWPGSAALIPSAATALLLVGGRGAPWQTLLSYWPLRWVGRISYSVYLVHWPLICLYRYWSIVSPTSAELWMLFAATLFLGAGQYIFVEKIFRLSSVPKLPQMFWMTGALNSIWTRLDRVLTKHQERIFALFLMVPAAAFCFAATIIMQGGFPDRMKRNRVQQASGELSFAGDVCNSSRSRCSFGAPTSTQIVYLIGDSHALNFVHGLDSFFKERNIRGIAFYDHGCLFLVGTTRFMQGVKDRACASNVAEAYRQISRDRHPVLIAGAYAGYAGEIGDADASLPFRGVNHEYIGWLAERFRRSLRFIEAEGRVTVLFTQSYDAGIDVAKCVLLRGIGSKECLPSSLATLEQSARPVDDMLYGLREQFPTITVVDTKSKFCASTSCTVMENGVFYFRDQTHLTNEGSLFLIEKIKPQLLNALGLKP